MSACACVFVCVRGCVCVKHNLTFKRVPVDASFGLIKRKLRRTNTLTPEHMYGVIKSSTKSLNTPVRAEDVDWRDWKTFLEQMFSKKIKNVNKQHHLYFRKDKVMTRAWLNETHSGALRLVRPDITIDEFMEITACLYDPAFQLPLNPVTEARENAFSEVYKQFVKTKRMTREEFLHQPQAVAAEEAPAEEAPAAPVGP
jgi:hypothetical protein